MPPDFVDIDFGETAAENESVEKLTDGYYPIADARARLLTGPDYLVLGRKGAGKSALAEHIRLTTAADERYLTSNLALEGLRDLASKDQLGERGDLSTSWGWQLMVYALDSLRRDEGGIRPTGFESTIEALEKSGWLPGAESIQTQVSARKVLLPTGVGGVGIESQFKEAPSLILERLQHTTEQFQTNTRHLILIDSLESALRMGADALTSLARLTSEVRRLNTRFSRSGAPVKFILFCRTDIFDAIPDSNKNQMRQDRTIELNWYTNPRQAKKSELIDILNLRAGVARDAELDVFDLYFEPFKDPEGLDIRGDILQKTRHTPRDIVQLMRCLRFAARRGYPVTKEQKLEAFHDYSRRYFLKEIRDELFDWFPRDVDRIEDTIREMDKKFFYQSHLMEAAKRQKTDDLDWMRILQLLYDCGAVGNAREAASSRVTTTYEFKYRSPSSSIRFSQLVVIHKGAWEAFSLH